MIQHGVKLNSLLVAQPVCTNVILYNREDENVVCDADVVQFSPVL